MTGRDTGGEYYELLTVYYFVPFIKPTGLDDHDQRQCFALRVWRMAEVPSVSGKDLGVKVEA